MYNQDFAISVCCICIHLHKRDEDIKTMILQLHYLPAAVLGCAFPYLVGFQSTSYFNFVIKLAG